MAARLRAALDIVVTLALLATCVVVIMTHWSRLWPTVHDPWTPNATISNEGAALKGDGDAPVVIVEWSDYQCPYCARVQRDVLMALEDQFIKTGKVQLAFRHKPLEKVHPFARQAAVAAVCAGEQGRFWEMHKALFQDDKDLTEAGIRSRAEVVGLDTGSFVACLGSSQAAARVREDARIASGLGLSGTPAFAVGRRQADGRVKVTTVFEGAKPLGAFVAAIAKAEARSGGRLAYMSRVAVAVGVAGGVALWLRKRRVAQLETS